MNATKHKRNKEAKIQFFPVFKPPEEHKIASEFDIKIYPPQTGNETRLPSKMFISLIRLPKNRQAWDAATGMGAKTPEWPEDLLEKIRSTPGAITVELKYRINSDDEKSEHSVKEAFLQIMRLVANHDASDTWQKVGG
jgi:hypothetical protein